ncbi:MAG: hypothetical protein H8K03_00855 [Nitrospira sp.]
MLPLRTELSDYSRACERLIAAAASADDTAFTQDETDWIAYYVAEMTNLVDQLVRKLKAQVLRDRETLQAFAVASEALFLTDTLSKGERDSIRHSVSYVTRKILVEKDGPAGDPSIEG